ncbi:hypothetical protein HS088_TW03G00872 [Tripterygium wilfordii]|uniref:Senescence regulator n=1 Tax=Tripterygium wilfordii TaxID=458696 RepID=A0A7J7DWJ9_TRIWF|nr:uncharacterized protein LOC119991874 [Tripterygium wilfordii]KAF5750534.1 hypothetical protein HS088_TW03G00872 [Tripterygium wilfordii]
MDSATRHRRSTSSDRFLFLPSYNSPTPADAAASAVGDELNEDDILWKGDFTAPNENNHNSTTSTTFNNHVHRSLPGFRNNSGILAALPGPDHGSVLYRKPSIPSSSSKGIPSMRRPPAPGDRELIQSLPSRNFKQSAPMQVPLLSIAMAKRMNSKFIEDDDVEGDEEMLPPHEIVARASGRELQTTFSVLEGVGRTLKGRDLRQVRNAVWRRTGFLD